METLGFYRDKHDEIKSCPANFPSCVQFFFDVIKTKLRLIYKLDQSYLNTGFLL